MSIDFDGVFTLRKTDCSSEFLEGTHWDLFDGVGLNRQNNEHLYKSSLFCCSLLLVIWLAIL